MKVIHDIGFTEDETESYRQQVFMNLWEAMRLLLEGMQELELKLADPNNRVRLPKTAPLSNSYADGLSLLLGVSQLL